MKKYFLVLLILMGFSIEVEAQNDSLPTKHTKKIQFNPIPYVNYSQSQKFMYGLYGILTFNTKAHDELSPRSTFGGGYIRTTRGSWFGNAFAQLFFDQDKWRIVAMAGKGNYNFQTYIDEVGVPTDFYDYSSNTIVAVIRIMRKVYKRNYLGLGYYYNDVDTKFETLPIDSTLTSNALNVLYLNDSRDNVYFPHKGIKAMVMYTMYPEWMGNKKNFGILNAYLNKYISTPGNNTWALRAMAKIGTTNLDFQRQIVISSVDLRGYTSGKYRGDAKMDIQAEFRYNLKPKFGLVGFGGLGTLFGSDIEEFNKKIYPSIGLGFRILAVKSTGMRFGMDVARGRDDWNFYFRIGEAF